MANFDSKVLSFARSHDFYAQRGDAAFERGELFAALANYRRACELMPDEPEYAIRLSDVLTQMGLFSRSNEALYPLLLSGDGDQDACWYRLGYNYYCAQMSGPAYDALAQYLRMFPDGEQALDAEEMIEYIEEVESNPAQTISYAEEQACMGERDLNERDYAAAEHALCVALLLDGDMLYAHEDLTSCYLRQGRLEECIDECRRLLAKEGGNVIALCNIARAQAQLGDEAASESTLREALLLGMNGDVDDAVTLLYTLAALGQEQKMPEYLRRTLEYSPYDEEVLLLSAINQYNLGDRLGAHRVFSQLCDIAPNDALYAYGLTQSGLPRDEAAERMPYEPLRDPLGAQDPFTLHLKKTMAALFALDPAEPLVPGSDLYRCARWCLVHHESEYVRRYTLRMLMRRDDAVSQQMLRLALLDPYMSDVCKFALFTAREAAGQDAPVWSLMHNRLRERSAKDAVRPGEEGRFQRELPAACFSWAQAHLDGRGAPFMQRCWDWLFAAYPFEYFIMRTQGAWGAAVCLATVKQLGCSCDVNKLCRSFGATRAIVEERARILQEGLPL